MAQHDQNIADGLSSAVRADMNNALAALFSNSSGATTPTPTAAYQTWVDTSVSPALWKVRNSANSAWLTLGSVGTALSILGANVSPSFGAQAISTTSSISFGDANVQLSISAGSPFWQADSTDYLAYNRASNFWQFVVGGTEEARIDVNGIQTAQWRIDTNYYATLSGGTVPFLAFDSGDYIQYNRTTNTLSVGIASLEALTITGSYFGAPSAYSATTASAANVFVATTGQLQRSTSSRRYKDEIQPLSIDESALVVSTLQPCSYRSKAEADDPNRRWLGFIAEEVAEVDPRLVEFNDNDEPESVAYDRLVVHLVNVCQQLQDRLAALEAQ